MLKRNLYRNFGAVTIGSFLKKAFGFPVTFNMYQKVLSILFIAQHLKNFNLISSRTNIIILFINISLIKKILCDTKCNT